MAEAVDDWKPVQNAPDDDWKPVGQGGADDWQPVGAPTEPVNLPAMFGGIDLSNNDEASAVTRSRIGDVWRAFSSRASEVYGDRPLGMSDEDYTKFQNAGWFRKEAFGEGPMGVVRAANELLVYQGFAKTLDFFTRAPAAAIEGMRAAGAEAGIPRDVMGMMLGEHEWGSPGTLRPPEPYVKPEKVRPVEYNEPPPASQGPKINWDRNTVGNNIPISYRGGDLSVIDVPVAALDAAFKATDKNFYIEEPKTEVSEYAKSGKPMSLAEVGVNKGRIGFTNGRNRLAVARDMGESTIPVAVEKDNVQELLATLDKYKSQPERIEYKSAGARPPWALAEEARQAPVTPPPMTRVQAAQTGITEVDRVLNSPVTKAVIENAVIDRSHDVPYMAGGSAPLDDPTVYIDHRVPREQTAPATAPANLPPVPDGYVRFFHGGDNPTTGGSRWVTPDVDYARNFRRTDEAPKNVHYVDIPKGDAFEVKAREWDEVDERSGTNMVGRYGAREMPEEWARQLKPVQYGTVSFDPADPWTVHENVEQHTMELLTKGGMTDEEAYRVAHFEFAEKAEQAWYTAHGIDQKAAEAEQQKWLPGIQHNTAHAEPSLMTQDFTGKIGRGEVDVPTVDELSDLQKQTREADRKNLGLDDKDYARLERLNRIIDRGGAEADRAQADKEAMLAGKNPPDLKLPDADEIKQLKREYEAIEKSDFESVEEYADGIARVLKRYIGRFTEGDGFARAVFRKAFEEAQKHGISTKALGNEVIDRYLADASPSDQQFMREKFAQFTAARLPAKGPNFPPNLYEKPYPHDHVEGAEHEAVTESPPTPDEVARAYTIINNAKELDAPQIAPGVILEAARDAGVIGPPKADIRDMSPEDAANARIPPNQPPKPPGGPPGGGPGAPGPTPPMNPWQKRFAQFVGKINKPEDVRQVIRDAAKENNDFAAARQGDIRLGQVEDLAEAAGVDPADITADQRRGIGRELRNDNEVRAGMQAMLQAAENVREAARDVKADPSPENLIKFQQAIMRRDMTVEQIVGLRAEWGRTGNVFQEFLNDVKDQKALSDFLKDQGKGSPEELKKLAEKLESLNGPQAARLLNDLRKPTGWDKILFYWTNSLISGPFTHLKYILANATFGAYDAAVVTPIAGAIGTARRVLTKSEEGVYMGEAAARTWGLLAGVPDAITAAWTAARDNIQTPLPGEVAKNINPVINQRPNPIGGLAGTIIGIPSRGAAGIHSFFNFLGYRAEIEAQAYRQAAKEGLKVSDDRFWQRRQQIANNPTPAMMDAAIKNGYKLTFIQELGTQSKKFQLFVNHPIGKSGVQPMKLVFPFLHIPLNLLKATYENTPAAFADKDMRANLTGKNGAVAQDTAYARIIGGGVVMAYVANLALNDRVTGDGPSDPEERKQWLLTHQPNSVRVGDNWVSYQRFGPIGDLLGIASNLVAVGSKVDEEKYGQAAAHVVKAASRMLLDEVGMQGLVNIIGATTDPDRKGSRYVSGVVDTFSPFSSLQRQTGAFMDPYLREAKTFVDQLRVGVPILREGLLPQRDWLGRKLDNPAYHAILREHEAVNDPLSREMQALQINPTPPQNRIGNVKLTPQLYDEYQATAGPITQRMLTALVTSPGWSNLPDNTRADTIRDWIKAAHKQAEGIFQAHHPELILAGIQQKADYATGATNTKRPKESPAGLQ